MKSCSWSKVCRFVPPPNQYSWFHFIQVMHWIMFLPKFLRIFHGTNHHLEDEMTDSHTSGFSPLNSQCACDIFLSFFPILTFSCADLQGEWVHTVAFWYFFTPCFFLMLKRRGDSFSMLTGIYVLLYSWFWWRRLNYFCFILWLILEWL
jgi:hypothetical protein